MPRRKPAAAPQCEELERRLLFSADFAPLALSAHAAGVEASAPVQAQRHEIVFVESNVAGADEIVRSLQASSGAGRTLEVVELDASADGLAQITTALAGRSDISALHLITHGSDGQVQLGASTLDAQALAGRAREVASWGAALADGADILLYGCDVGAGSAGAQFVDQLAHLTGADVAASSNLTGSASAGGDWVLEVHTGAIETALAPSASLQQHWNGVLATFTVTNANDSGAGSFRQAVIDANANAGADTIAFSIGSGVQSITFASALPTITDVLTIDGRTQAGFGGTPLIELDGGGGSGDALNFSAGSGGSAVYGLSVVNFSGSGIRLDTGADGITLAGNYIGLRADGSTAAGNGGYGILVMSSGNTIGGTTALDTNVISANQRDGLRISAGGADVVSGNFIGTDAGGTLARGNAGAGIRIDGGSGGSTIGGTAAGAGNLVSANGADGILSFGVSDLVIQGNFIGVDASGSASLGNGHFGISVAGGAARTLVGGPVAGAGNLVAANGWGGIDVSDLGTDATRIQDNCVGLNAAGNAALGNSGAGIQVVNSASNTTIDGNLVSGNTGDGIQLHSSSSGTVVTGNFVGTDASGSAALGNGAVGISVSGQSSGNRVGGTTTAEINVVSGNSHSGIEVRDTGTAGNVVEGNYVGVDATGSFALANGQYGIAVNNGASGTVVGGAVAGAGNLVSGNNWTGINVSDAGTDGVLVQGNWVGLNAPGNAAIGNQAGIDVTSGATNTTLDRNVVAGNNNTGISLKGGSSGAIVTGNLIGTDITGTAALANGGQGIAVNTQSTGNRIGGTTAAERNIVSGNGGVGIEVSDTGTTGNLIEGNYVGLDSTGSAALANGSDGVYVHDGANNTTIGGTAAGAGNVISGNTARGLSISIATGTQVYGNFIGTDASGSVAVGNGGIGLLLVGANNAVVGNGTLAGANTISGNTVDGINIENSSGLLIQGNYVGTNASGAVLGNGSEGIFLYSNSVNNLIGGTAPGQGNVVAYNTFHGISTGGTNVLGNSFLGNSIFSNGYRGIDLGGDGLTANDPGDSDTGWNNLQNFPVLASALVNGSLTTITGSLNSTASTTFRVEFFSNPTVNPTGYGDGRTYLGFVDVTTDASGNAVFTFQASGPAAGDWVSATATNASTGDTSEYAQSVQAALNNAPVLDASKNPALANEMEDIGAPVGAVGTLVSSLVDFAVPAGQVDNVSDSDAGSLLGIAVTGADTTHGSWWYSTDDGTTWAALGSVSDSSARLLSADASTRLYFQPSASFYGSVPAALTLRAWDGTSGSNGALADASAGGGSTAFSTASDTASLNVTGAYLVTNTNDSGAGSLRQAIVNANAHAGTETIEFAIGAGVQTIALSSLLPTVTGPVVIDARTETGYAGTPLVEIDGLALGGSGLAFGAGSGGSAVYGLSIIDFSGVGIELQAGADGITVAGNYLGLRADGLTPVGNGDGLFVSSGGNTIGGTAAGAGNVISGNLVDGIAFSGPAASGNAVLGNTIGLTSAGDAAMANGNNGIAIFGGASNNTIGGTTASARNLISGNAGDGLQLTGVGTSGNVIEGNYIGLTANGSVVMSNTAGVSVDFGASGNTVGGVAAGAGNVISGNRSDGVQLGNGTSGNLVAGNLIGLDGTGTVALGNAGDGVAIYGNATGNTVGGTTAGARNVIAGSVDDGVSISGAGTVNNWIAGNFIGLNAAGNAALSNAGNGVGVYNTGAGGNTIGGTAAGAGNVISGNLNDGVVVGNASSIVVQGNIIGLDASGSSVLDNGANGIELAPGTVNALIGGTSASAGNVISGNAGVGVLVNGTTGTTIERNFIGLTANGAVAMGNGVGVSVDLGASGTIIGSSGNGNVISGNRGDGVQLQGGSSGTLVAGNFIGLSANGSAALGNGGGGSGDGIAVSGASTGNTLGGSTAGDGNVVSGNLGDGISFSGSGTSGNTVAGNFIGLNAAGNAILSNAGNGVSVLAGADGNTIGGTAAGAGNVISGNFGDGVLVSGAASTVLQGNQIGTDAAGTGALGNHGHGIELVQGAHDNVIGGASAAAGNLVSGNAGDGIRLADAGTTANLLQGNVIGLDVTRSAVLGNGLAGVAIESGASANTVGSAGAGNVVAGNAGNGLSIQADGNTVQGNLIGTNGVGAAGLGNGGDGVRFVGNALNNLVGGTGAGQGNVIADNGGAGIATDNVAAIDGNGFLGNTIRANAGLGIDLGADGVTANDAGDADTGPNGLQNCPVLTGANYVGNTLTVLGTLNSSASVTFRIEVFANTTSDPSGNGEGETFLGAFNVTTDAGGNASFQAALAGVTLLVGQSISATATVLTGSGTPSSTSEFARNVVLDTPPSITSNGGGANASVTLPENTTAVTTVTATDADAGTTLTYSIVGGADAARFTIDAQTGALRFATAPDFEAPADANADNIYDVTVQASDGALTATQSLAVHVSNVNEAPAITSNGGGSSAAVTVAPGSAAVTTVAAADPDAGTSLRYAIAGGADAALFSIDAQTGVLSFVSPPAGAATPTTYQVTVQASDGSLATAQAITVTVAAAPQNTAATTPGLPTLPSTEFPSATDATASSAVSAPAEQAGATGSVGGGIKSRDSTQYVFVGTNDTVGAAVDAVNAATPGRAPGAGATSWVVAVPQGAAADADVPQAPPAPSGAGHAAAEEPVVQEAASNAAPLAGAATDWLSDVKLVWRLELQGWKGPALDEHDAAGPDAAPAALLAAPVERAAGGEASSSLQVQALRLGSGALAFAGVWWALRSSALAGSVLASLPAWRSIDPLPVLDKAPAAGREDLPIGAEEAYASEDELGLKAAPGARNGGAA